MMGFLISGPTYSFGNNMSLINNTSKPDSQLRKKSNLIFFHAVREAVAMKEIMTELSVTNPADLFTKVLPGGEQPKVIVR
jgi:hypothetical protein